MLRTASISCRQKEGQFHSRRSHASGQGLRDLTSLAVFRVPPMDIAKETCYCSFAGRKGDPSMTEPKSEVFQGTLDLMVLKTLQAMGPLHGYGIARRIEQLSEQLLRLNEGTVYASLLRLAQKGWIRSEWGTSENNRKARVYSISAAGRRKLAREAAYWERLRAV